jgi:hypothetical protein
VPYFIGELHQLEGLQADGCPLVAPLNSLYAKDPLLLVKLHDTRLQASFKLQFLRIKSRAMACLSLGSCVQVLEKNKNGVRQGLRVLS